MTIEQFISLWLANKLQRQIKTTVTENEISVTLDDAEDVNKFIRESTFAIVVQFESKKDAAETSMAVQEAFKSLSNENYIMGASVLTEQANPEELPRVWEYYVAVKVRHRRRTSWLA